MAAREGDPPGNGASDLENLAAKIGNRDYRTGGQEMIYLLTTPPPGQVCSAPADGNLGVVRVTTPADGGEVAPPLDFCEYCWPRLLSTYRRMGHQVADITGNLKSLAAEFPHWRIFTSDAGRLYASARLKGPQGTTVFAWTVAALRGEIEQAERTAARSLNGVTV